MFSCGKSSNIEILSFIPLKREILNKSPIFMIFVKKITPIKNLNIILRYLNFLIIYLLFLSLLLFVLLKLLVEPGRGRAERRGRRSSYNGCTLAHVPCFFYKVYPCIISRNTRFKKSESWFLVLCSFSGLFIITTSKYVRLNFNIVFA